MRPASPSFGTFLQEWQRLIRSFLLADLTRWRAGGLLVCAAFAALAVSGLLIGAAAHLVLALLGEPRLAITFPYLQPALALWHLPGPPWLVLGLTGLGAGLGVALLSACLPVVMRRRWWALLGLFILLVVGTAVDVAFTEGNGAVMEALNARSAPRFWASAIGLSAIYLLTLPLQYLNGYGQQCLAVVWRASATTALQRRYLRRQAYDRLERQGPGGQEPPVDNPDQRIADDVNRAVFTSTDLLFGFCGILLVEQFKRNAFVLVKLCAELCNGIQGSIDFTVLIHLIVLGVTVCSIWLPGIYFSKI